MSLQTRINALITAIGADINALVTSRGTMASLTTTQKANLVGAINELDAAIDLLAGGSGAIDDSATSLSTTWSSTKVTSAIAASISDVVNGAPGAFDTLKELADELASQDSVASGLVTAVANRVRFDAPQTLTAPQMAQANANMGSLSLVQAGDPETDLVALYTVAKA